MKNMNINFKHIIISFAAVFILSFMSNCEDTIGLGKQPDIISPNLKIIAPKPEEGQKDIKVGSLFEITGEAKDNSSGASRMTIQVTRYNEQINPPGLVDIGREWRYNKGWEWKEGSNSPWKGYTEDSYKDAGDITLVSTPKWNVSEKTVYWSLPITLDGFPKGDYFFTIKVWDGAGNSDSASVKKITIYHDTENPELTIISLGEYPIEYGDGYSYPVRFDSFIYDPVNRPESTYSYIENWVNKTLSFNWEIDKDVSGSCTLIIEITNRYDITTGLGKELYYRYTWDSSKQLPRYGAFTDEAPRAGYEKVAGAIKVEDIYPRDPVTEQRKGTFADNEFIPMQIVVELIDGTGKKDRSPAKGWFAYYPRTDRPFVDLKDVYKHDPLREIPQDAPDKFYLWKGREITNNKVYDNDGVASISWKVYKLNDIGLNPTGNPSDIWTGYHNFTVAPYEYSLDTNSFGVGRFKIEIDSTDTSGVQGETLKAYFSIESNATPSVRILDEPVRNTLLLGDAAGNFRIKGIAQIEDNDDPTINIVRVDKVSVVWIKPGSTYQADYFSYLDRDYEGWNAVMNTSSYTDGNGNKLWDIPVNFVNSTNGNNNVNRQEDYSFDRQFNIFNDLGGVTGNPTGPQMFIIRVYSEGSLNRPKSRTESITTLGDTTRPNIKINTIKYWEHTGNNNYKLPVEYSRSNDTFPMLTKIYDNDKIQLIGTVSDNSSTNWTGLTDAQLKNYFRDYSVTWTGEEKNYTFAQSLDSNINIRNGTWQTPEFTFGTVNIDARVILRAAIKDHNNTEGEDIINIIVETDTPTLVRITSETGNGSYGEEKDTDPDRDGKQKYIDINLDFNKNVRFFQEFQTYPNNPQNAPYLTLNNGGEAYFLGGNRENKLKFRYYVDGDADLTIPTMKSGKGGVSTEKLNVTKIVWTSDHPVTNLTSDEFIPVFLNEPYVYDPAFSYSLAGGKNIKIDKVAPVLASVNPITTSASESPRLHGVGSNIYITLNFNEQLNVTVKDKNNFYLTLKGTAASNPITGNNVRAIYDHHGPTSITFLYVVDVNQNTAQLGVASINMATNIITDIADNPFNVMSANSSLATGGSLNKTIIIDTTPPLAPALANITAGKNYYGAWSFNVTGVESGATVEYCLKYDGNPSSTDNHWVRTSTPTNIPLNINGNYNIAARQSDAATPNANVSAPSAVISNITVDTQPLLVRLGSSTSDGIYGVGREIDVDLVFRKAVYINTSSIGESGSATLRLAMKGLTPAANANAWLQNISADRKTYTFRFRVAEGHNTDRLDVVHEDTAITFGNVTFYDSATQNTDTAINSFIRMTDIQASSGFKLQKQIKILTGRPTASSISGTTPSSIRITFSRDIYRGDTQGKLKVIQNESGYRIPAVMTEARWSEIFVGRSDITGFTTAQWRTLGEQLYYRGSNGATVSGTTATPDTTVRRVLNYAIVARDDASIDSTNIPGVSITGRTPATVTYSVLREALRNAEAVSFYALDNEVSIVSNNTLVVNLTSTGKTLPVKGAEYTWTIPNGFVKDVLENPNGASSAGNDTSGSLSGTLQITDTGCENPVIRVNKGLIESITGTNNARQAQQPLETQFKIDCRTPGSTVQYMTRNTTDSIGRIIMRSNQDNVPNRLPNLGNQEHGDFTSFNAAKGRPQSGNATNQYWNATTGLFQNNNANGALINGLNHWTPMAAWPNTFVTNYTVGASVTIGRNSNNIANYNDGGMIYHIHAQSRRTASGTGSTWGQDVYEAAYRSVFVFSNMGINGNSNLADVGANLTAGRARFYVRGGDSISGEPSIPDFPIGRNKAAANKSRLMTPFNISTPAATTNGFGASPYTSGTIRDNNIVGVPANADTAAYNDNGQYMWVWVTWGITQNAYVDVFSCVMANSSIGNIIVNGQTVAYNWHPTDKTKELTSGWSTSKAHYPVVPGRTTVVETRPVYYDQVDGWRGEALGLSAAMEIPGTIKLE